MCASVDLRLVNKKCLESLAYAGALDCLKGTRAQLFASIDAAIDYGNSFQKDRRRGQTSLFDTRRLGCARHRRARRPNRPLPMWSRGPTTSCLAKEKEVLNFYVSGHPLERFQDEIRGFADISAQAGIAGKS